jgi:hypothetical protein
MLKSPAHTTDGYLAQAAAALTLNDTFEFHVSNGHGCFPAQLALWEMAHAGGFPVPAWVKKHVKEKAAGGRTKKRRRSSTAH